MENRKKGIRIIALVSLQHMLVDFICALIMYHMVIDGIANRSVIYNLCAFALQLPFGLVADAVNDRSGKAGKICIGLSIPFLAAGCYGIPAVLGIGNALFHVGGGIITMNVDDSEQFKGRGLGTFVAPGALGLLAGNLIGSHTMLIACVALALMTVLYVLLIRQDYQLNINNESKQKENIIGIVLCCLTVVVIRSFVGMTVSFTWKNTVLRIIISVIAIAAGKTLGGFAAAEYGIRKTTVASLLLAMVCFLFKDYMVAGLTGLLLFNMTMPLTLYILADTMKGMPGTAFGILTFGLFLGYYPTAAFSFSFDTGFTSAAGCLISLVLLLMAEKNRYE